MGSRRPGWGSVEEAELEPLLRLQEQEELNLPVALGLLGQAEAEVRVEQVRVGGRNQHMLLEAGRAGLRGSHDHLRPAAHSHDQVERHQDAALCLEVVLEHLGG